MTEQQLDKLHECCEALQDTIEKYTGNKKVIVMWAAMDDDTMASSATAGEMTNTDLFELAFEVNARLQYIAEKQNE